MKMQAHLKSRGTGIRVNNQQAFAKRIKGKKELSPHGDTYDFSSIFDPLHELVVVAKGKLKELRVLFDNFSYRRWVAHDAVEREYFSEMVIVLLLTVDAIEECSNLDHFDVWRLGEVLLEKKGSNMSCKGIRRVFVLSCPELIRRMQICWWILKFLENTSKRGQLVKGKEAFDVSCGAALSTRTIDEFVQCFPQVNFIQFFYDK